MRVLAIDDEARAREALEQAIREAAPTAELTVCDSAAEALSLAATTAFDVAFLDVCMPNMDGIALARELMRLAPCINVIFVTAYERYMADAFRLHCSGYLLKPVTSGLVADELANLRHPIKQQPRDPGLFMRCFGDFEAFCNGSQLQFRRAKTKELLAYLVDRRGAMVSLHEVDAALWEDAPHGASISGSYLRTLVADLRHTLEAAGYPDMLLKSYGQVGLDITAFGCDYYDYLHGDERAIRDWSGEYMSQYSWAERTRAELMR